MRAAAIALAAALMLAFGCAAAALAQGGENAPPTELWENYPLDAPAPDHSTTRGELAPRPAEPSHDAAAPRPADDGPSPFVLMIPPLIVAAGILSQRPANVAAESRCETSCRVPAPSVARSSGLRR